MSRFDAGKIAYQAYGSAPPGWVVPEGYTVEWDELPADLQEAWARAASAVREAYSGH